MFISHLGGSNSIIIKQESSLKAYEFSLILKIIEYNGLFQTTIHNNVTHTVKPYVLRSVQHKKS